MKRTVRASLLDQLLALKQRNQFFLDSEPTTQPVAVYLDPGRFELEQQLFQGFPTAVAHSSEFDRPGSFLRTEAHGLPLLLLRGDDGQPRIFLNVCRHRGTRLVDTQNGCRKRFSCPYHGWTWDSRGRFVSAPHFEAGFPGVKRRDLGLTALRAAEHGGFLWLLPEEYGPPERSPFFSTLEPDLEWTGIERLAVHRSELQVRKCNWKLLVEGGLEAYHFRVAHRKTIARHFNDNLSSYQFLGPHLRSILPRASIIDLERQPRESWDLRKHANVLYTVFPRTMLLVQSDHIIWISLRPRRHDQTEVRLVTLVPRQSDRPTAYWDKNHELTVATLNEDFDLAESIQAGLASGANRSLHFGRFEGALKVFNDTIDRQLESLNGP